jgi:hypothetical protein
MNGTITTDISPSRLTLQRAAAWAGIAGPVLFVAIFLMLEVVQGSEYDRMSETISALAAGQNGWVQSANFVLLGTCTIVFAVGLHRSTNPSRGGLAGPLLLGVSGVANLVAATVPVRLDTSGATYIPTGHVVGGTMFFATAAASLVVLSFRLRKDARWSGLATYTFTSGVVAVIAFFVMGALVVPDDAPLHEYAGIGQRTVVCVVLACRAVLALRLLRVATR